MPYMNDMSTLADVVGPAYAAQQIGMQNAQGNQEADIKNQVLAGQAPAEIQKPGLQNLFTQAQTAAQDATTQGTQLGNLEKAGTLGSSINATNAGNQVKLTQDQAQKLSTLGQMAGQIAGYMDNVPQPARPAMMQQLAQQYGLDLNKMPGIESGDPDVLRSVSQKMVQMSAPYQTGMAEQTLKNQGAADVAGISGNARISAAEASANARIQAANITKQMHEQQQTFEQAAVRLQGTNPQLAQQYAQAALQLKQAQAGITNQLIQGQPLQMPDITSGGGGASGGAPAAPPQGNAIEAEMRKRGLLK